MKIGAHQKARETEKKEIARQQEVGYNDSLEGGSSIVVGQQLSVDSYDALADSITQDHQTFPN